MPKRFFSVLAVASLAMVSMVLSTFSAVAGTNGAASCAAIKAVNPSAVDGNYTLAIGTAQVPVYCSNMGGNPWEYLPLQKTGEGQNFSQYTAGGASPGTSVVTHYTKLRFDPHPVSFNPLIFRVNIADQKFATSTGQLCHSASGACPAGSLVTAMPYAVAMDCLGSGSPGGKGNLDLSGLPFDVVNTFAVQSFGGTGSATYVNPQVVNLAAGGYCGWIAPAMTYNPINQNPLGDANGGWDLQLQFSPPPLLSLPFS
ncbi:MAG: GON domain-containing protein [Pseudonocardiaceae bacterium]